MSPYVFVREVAKGGMGKVELVVRKDGRFARVYARKRLHDAFAGDPEVRAMFLDEARIAGLVRHVNAVAVHDVGEDDRGPFLVMDWVEGLPASTIASETAQAGRRIPLQVAISIVRQAALGLHAAHELVGSGGRALAVVHRDVSPQNVLVDFDGVVRVTDFGVARALDQAAQTSAGVLKGKFGYMSPEQIRFQPIDRRSDLFSLGVVLYELAAGRRLYSGEREAVFRRILEEPPPDLGDARPEAPPALVEIVFQLLAKDAALRPASALEVATRLEAIGARLASEEGTVAVADWLAEDFAQARDRERSLVARALEMGDAPAGAPTIFEGRRRPRLRRLVVIALAAAVLFVGAGLWIGSAGPSASPGSAAPVRVIVRAPFSASPPSPPATVAPASSTPTAPPARPRRDPARRKEGGTAVPSWSWE
jgi:serine/threonine-protein kinase